MTQGSRANLRRELERQLVSDGDLDAFCIDHFPCTYRTFSSGMNRQQKMNLLLSRESSEQIACELGIINYSPISEMRSTAFPWSVAKRSVAYIVTLALLGLMLGLVSNAQILAQRGPKDIFILHSSPTGAHIWEKRTGRQLGTTPWIIETKFLGQTVCLEKAGHHPEIINLSKSQLSEQIVILRPAETSSTEVCDVPVPIP